MQEIDQSFESLPLAAMADAALTEARRAGARYAAFHCTRIRNAEVRARDGKAAGCDDLVDTRFGVRVLLDGCWGFAASGKLNCDEAARVTASATAMAHIARDVSEPTELAEEPAYPRARWVSSYKQNPFAIGESDKLEVLSEWCRRLLSSPHVDHVYGKIRSAQENKFYADLAGTSAMQQRVRIYPQVTAVALGGPDNTFETMRTVGPPTARGWEYVLGDGWDWETELEQIPDLLREKQLATSASSGMYNLVIDGSNLWLVIHETIGHATELDRILGYEAGYAGTSFVAFDKIGMEYGSDLVNVVADRTTEHGLATVGFDDEGVAAQSWAIIRRGKLAGFQVNRSLAWVKDLGRSNGCAFAANGGDVPVQRMPNVSLLPAPSGPTLNDLIGQVSNGIYVAGDKSWSIDSERRNFQFTGQRFFKIENGRMAGQLRNVAYQGNTTDFWRSMVLLGGKSTYQLYGADYCGKAQPLQIAAASHGSPTAVFRNIRIVNTADGAIR